MVSDKYFITPGGTLPCDSERTLMLTTKSLNDVLDDLASNSPAPGGGSVAALAGAMGAALTSMVCNLTVGKKKYADVENEIRLVLQRSEKLRRTLTHLIDRDTDAFNSVMRAFGLPKDTDDQKMRRTEALQTATIDAARVPLEVMRLCLEGMKLAKTVSEKGNVNSISDAGVSAIMLYGGLESAALNVQINLGNLQDKGFVETTGAEMRALLNEGFNLMQSTLAVVQERMAKPT